MLSSVFLFFASTLNYYFISDDFVYTRFNSISELLNLNQGEYHYNPVFWGLLFAVKQIFGLIPLSYHFLTVVIHLVNILLVYFLAKNLTKNNKIAFLSSLVFSFYFANYEVVFWITGISTSLMVTFYILGLLSFIKYIKHKQYLFYVLFLIFFILSILTHEYAITLPIICFIYYFQFSKSKEILKVLAFPVLFILIVTILKSLYSNASLFISLPTIGRFFISVIKSYLYLFMPFPYFIDSLPKFLLPILFIFLFLFLLIKSLKNKLKIFLFLWTFIDVFLFSATSATQARYLYFSFIPAVILLILILNINSRKILYMFLIVIAGISFMQKQKIYWTQSSEITKNTLEYIKNNAEDNKPLYLVNFPDSVNGPPWNAYVFRRGLNYALGNTNIFFYRTIPLDEKVREDEHIEPEKLIELKEKGNVFIFDSNLLIVN
ncbi:glycosyltransferase family 39 protein [Candidatus Gottesmanbacteria bacterium]|nr:glycosyltransferase family 39 protein [Candidatus Gottesmanbacteria bacterium]